ncbi:response regulator [Desulfovibrio inopinatus]|uniref:response regulator n=1 Tax=Desulfovibrio inopinatus TaxID=102109 RepID=UPI000410A02A|nr:HD domain-containing phosphohydrolase [Desulfovibrio inopinatus]
MKRILVVDDSPEIRDAISSFLEIDYDIQIAQDGFEAVSNVTENPVDLVLLDIKMPGIDGFETMRRMHGIRPGLPVIFITAHKDLAQFHSAFFEGAEDFVVKPFDLYDLEERIKRTFHFRDTADIIFPNDMAMSMARCFARAVSFKDEYTGCHSERVAIYAMVIGRELGFSGHDIHSLLLESLVHDVGKLGIRDAVLLKPGKLDGPGEWDHMKSHAEKTYQILAEITIPGWEEVAFNASSHHERFGGGGYPRGLVGEDIPLRARILALADIWDAVNSKRTYKEAFTLTRSLEIMNSLRGKTLDPHLVDVFFAAREKGAFDPAFLATVQEKEKMTGMKREYLL